MASIFKNPNVGGTKHVGSAVAAAALYAAQQKQQQQNKIKAEAQAEIKRLRPDILDSIKNYIYGNTDQTLAQTYGGSAATVPAALQRYNLPYSVYSLAYQDRQTYDQQMKKGYSQADSVLFGSLGISPPANTPTRYGYEGNLYNDVPSRGGSNQVGTYNANPNTGVVNYGSPATSSTPSTSGTTSGSPIGNILSQGIPGGGGTPQTAQEALQQANDANNTRYLQALGLFDSQYQNLNNVGSVGEKRITQAENQALANRTQDLIGRGLYGSTTGINYDRAIRSDAEFSRQALQESLARERNNVLTGAAGLIERRSDVGPDLGLFAQLTSDAAASPNAGLEGLTWAATGLPVSANDPYQAQINSILKNVQERSQTTYDPVQAAKDQIAIEQAIAAARAQAEADAKAQAIRDQQKLDAKNRNLYGVNPETQKPFTSASERNDYFTARNAAAKQTSPSTPSYVDYILGDF